MDLWIWELESYDYDATEIKSQGNQKVLEKQEKWTCFTMFPAGGFIQKRYYSQFTFYLKLIIGYSHHLHSFLFLNNLLIRHFTGAKKDGCVYVKNTRVGVGEPRAECQSSNW